MPSPTDIWCLLVYTVPAGMTSSRFDLYIDNSTKPVAFANAPVTANFRVALSEGYHTYEIKCVNRQLVQGRETNFTSRAAGGSFRVDLKNREFLVGTTNNYLADAIIQYILDAANYVDGVATYSLNLIGEIVTGSWAVRQTTNRGAASTSENYNPQTDSYNDFSGTGGSFSDDYPLEAQVHVEVRGAGGSAGLNIIDFVAGEPPAPNPTAIQLDADITLADAINSSSLNSVTLFLFGSEVPPDTVNYYLTNGSQFSVTVEQFVAGLATATSGPLFDALFGLSDQILSYGRLDENGVITSVGTFGITNE